MSCHPASESEPVMQSLFYIPLTNTPLHRISCPPPSFVCIAVVLPIQTPTSAPAPAPTPAPVQLQFPVPQSKASPSPMYYSTGPSRLHQRISSNSSSLSYHMKL